MAALFSAPQPPPLPPPPPLPLDPEVEARRLRLEALERRRRGRAGTIATSVRGLLTDVRNGGSGKTLLGE